VSGVSTELVNSMLPQRLRERLATLHLTVVGLCADGRVVAQNESSRLERMVLTSHQFATAAHEHFDDFLETPVKPVEVWPEVYLSALPMRRRRRILVQSNQPQVFAVMFIGPGFLSSDQLHRLCDANELDYQAMVSQAIQTESSSLVSPQEAARLSEMLAWMQQDSQEIERRGGELHTMSRQLGDTYEELSLLYKLSTNMTVDQPPELFLTEACREMQQVIGVKWMALQLTDTEPRLNKLSGKIFIAGESQAEQARLSRIGMQLLTDHQLEGHPRVVDDVTTLRVPGLSQLTNEMLMISLLRENKPLGMLFGSDKIDGSHISSIDSKLCNSLVSSMSIFIENMMLYEDMHSMFMGTLHALTNSIDAKDNYTHGHSERVALMSRMLAEAAGLDPHQVERVYIAGLVHDVGKIGVPEAVLCKPGKLTEEEFRLIKLHPEIGGRILQDIRQMQDLIPGVLYHHERWDGRGYPHNLRGKEIPIFGRLIGLADSFDAMSSNRTYRQALDHQQVISEIRRCAGTQFDPELAQVFTHLDFKPFYELIQKHQRRSAPTDIQTTPTTPPSAEADS
jgi:HD-GYP domain-containing protein (c-di-GMP phosphodiesterase class II)